MLMCPKSHLQFSFSLSCRRAQARNAHKRNGEGIERIRRIHETTKLDMQYTDARCTVEAGIFTKRNV